MDLVYIPPTNPWETETQRNEVILDFVQNLFSVFNVVTAEAIIVPDPTHNDRRFFRKIQIQSPQEAWPTSKWVFTAYFKHLALTKAGREQE